VIIVLATVLVAAASFLEHRQKPLPARGWVGLAILASGEWLMLRGVEPVATYFTPLAWTAYLLLADAALEALTGRSPMRQKPRQFLRVVFLSIPLWLVFEAYNLRLGNWTYVGLPRNVVARWFGYGWSFATITPALLLTAELIAALGCFSGAGRPWRLSQRAENLLMVLGAVFLIAPVALPRRAGAYLFGFVWVGFALLLDPLLKRRGEASLLGEIARGDYARLRSLLASGWICGWLWEFWNFWAAAKWQYIFPIFQHWKVFAMPAPGYLGFPPFAVETYVMYVFAARLLGWPVVCAATEELPA
jgi:hypothetical protein